MAETSLRKKYKQERLEKLQLQQKVEMQSQTIDEQDDLIVELRKNNKKKDNIIKKKDNIIKKKDNIIVELRKDGEVKTEEINKLEATLKAYDNAHTPPSKKLRPKPQPRKKTGRARGGQKGHPGKTNKPKPTEFVTHTPTKCPDCGSKKLQVTKTVKRNIIDRKIVKTVTVTQHNINTCRCTDCGHDKIIPDLAGVIPKDGDYGPGLVSDVISDYEARMPIRMIARRSKKKFGISLSTGAISNMIQRTGLRLGAPAKMILQLLYNAKILHMDETSFRLHGRNIWVWILLNPETGDVCYIIRPSRGGDVLQEVLPNWKGTIVCDGWSPYGKYTIQRCWAHLIREIRELSEKNPDYANALDALERMQKIYGNAKKKRPVKDRQKAHDLFASQIRKIISEYHEDDILGPFMRKLENALPDLFRFVLNPKIPPTNNAAERGLREIVVRRKIHGSMRSDMTPEVMGNIFTCVMTWNNQGLDYLDEMIRYL